MLQNPKFFLAASEYLEIEKGGCCVQRITKRCGSQQSFIAIDLCLFFFRMVRTKWKPTDEHIYGTDSTF